MEERIIQISSGQGPEECERVVFLLFEKMKQEADGQQLHTEILELVPGRQKHTYLSVLFRLKGMSVLPFCESWQGSIQWIAQSPYRKFHKRKNWFAGIKIYAVPEQKQWDEKDFTYQTLRASGPGGQNVNKVETAVRAIHTPSGLSVTASAERSQLMNKKAACERLKHKLISIQLRESEQAEKQQWLEHRHLNRGGASRVFSAALL